MEQRQRAGGAEHRLGRSDAVRLSAGLLRRDVSTWLDRGARRPHGPQASIVASFAKRTPSQHRGASGTRPDGSIALRVAPQHGYLCAPQFGGVGAGMLPAGRPVLHSKHS